MKKTRQILLIAALVLAGFIFRDQLDGWANRLASAVSGRLPGIEQVVFEVSELADFSSRTAGEVSAPGPLRGLFESPYSFLTVAGTIEATNEQRLTVGLPAFKPNALLNEAARRKLEDMFARQYFEHVSPDGVSPGELIANAGYEFVKVGENLALGNWSDDVAIVAAWMESPPHRDNILTPTYTEIGVAVGQGIFEGRKTWLAVQEFGRPISACPSVDAFLESKISLGQTALKALSDRIDRTREGLERDKSSGQTSPEATRAYNQRIDEYNSLVKRYNKLADELKIEVAAYNEQVKAFNACLDL